ncbi:tyrosine-type recombinase/integrase [Desulfosporosinus metallidurans]|uniref:Site-specific tyrosine recombinase n=1 Tax=Desulfosporosinus metallidurans TaxID=1888891 RepID=A0A1Q8QYT9_9FIRM|nr:tyrosine-type recombinase/integrase [Desulfosporosinus metallidurans]OLN32461.1 Site-specific tyrosine recombinase [Desulfosporosinus metallidurans]
MDAIESFVREHLSAKAETTKETYRQVLIQFDRWLKGTGTDLSGFVRTDVQQYIDYLVAKKKSAGTINKIFNALKSFCRYANKTKAIENIRVIKQPNILQQAPKALDKRETHRILRETDRRGNHRDYAIVVLLLNTGLRVGELVKLDRSDVEISERKGELTVRWAKGGKAATLPLNNESRKALTEYLDTRRTDNNPALFLSNRCERISKRTVQYLMEQLGINAHALRHTFITQLVRSGVDISIVQALSRHASADMILRYSKPAKEDLEETVNHLVF